MNFLGLQPIYGIII